MKYLLWNGPKTYWTFENEAELKQFIDLYGMPGQGETLYRLHNVTQHLDAILKTVDNK
jgi:hypothetical protein